MTCKIARCECPKAAHVCVSCHCLEWCVNNTPQTRREKTRRKENTKGMGTGKRKRQREKAKGGQPMQQTPRTQPGRAEKHRGKEEASDHTTTPWKGKGTAGDEPGYTPTPEDLRLREVYKDCVHANPGTHLDRGIRDNSTWQACLRDLTVMP